MPFHTTPQYNAGQYVSPIGPCIAGMVMSAWMMSAGRDLKRGANYPFKNRGKLRGIYGSVEGDDCRDRNLATCLVSEPVAKTEAKRAAENANPWLGRSVA